MSKKRHRGNPRRQGRGLPHKRTAESKALGRLRAGLRHVSAYLRRNWAVVRACLVFAACMLVFMLVYSRLTDNTLFEGFRSFTARATAAFLNLFGGGVNVDGVMVSSAGFSMGIIEACTGIVPMAIFASAVLAYPSSARHKVIGISLGVLGLYAVNLVRTASLFFVGAHFPGFFDTAHYLVWQSLMIMVAIVFWLLWVSRLAHVAAK